VVRLAKTLLEALQGLLQALAHLERRTRLTEAERPTLK